MRCSSRFLCLVATIALATGCGGKPAPEAAPTPQPTDDSAARARARQDSIDAANRARADAETRAMAERDRMAREEADRLARLRGTLTDELAAVINFDFDKADVRSDDQSNLDRKAAILTANSGLRLRISGHADERGSDEYNLALSNRRAAAAKRYIVNQGITAGRLDVVSYGEERPLDPGHDETAWSKNRRDEFEIVAGGDQLVSP